jgi:hypothetical protein
MDIVEQLQRLTKALRQADLEYALCGGFALAAHGIVRATEDIDLMIEEHSLTLLRETVESLGYIFQPRPCKVKGR